MQLKVYTAVFLIDENDAVLCLKRASWKRFAPNKYTGIGGTVEPGEVETIEESLKREFEEETKISFSLLQNLTLRGSMFVTSRDENDHLIYYFTAQIKRRAVTDLSCTEGELVWIQRKNFEKIAWIGTVKIVVPYIFDTKIKRFSALLDETSKEKSVLVKK
jgi:8-oxo-dGTP diphosphatase